MNTLLRWLSPPIFEEEERTHRAKNLHNILALLFLFEIFFGGLTLLIFDESPYPFLFVAISFLFTVICYRFLQLRRLSFASLLLCVFLGIVIFAAALFSNGINSIVIPVYVAVVLIAGLLLTTGRSILFALFGILGVIGLYWVDNFGLLAISDANLPVLIKIAIPGFIFIFAALLFRGVTRNTNETLQRVRQNETALELSNQELQYIRNTLEQHIADRTAQLEAGLEIGRTISGILNPDELGKKVVTQITSLFDYDFSVIYMLAPARNQLIGKYTSRKANPSDPQIIELPSLDPHSTIGIALNTQKPGVNYDTRGRNSAFNYLQPGTHSEISLPIVTGGNVLGVLNIQSAKPAAFTEKSVDTLQGIASQIAVAFENIRLFQQTQEQLEEINRLNQFYLQTTWRAILTRHSLAFEFKDGNLIEKKDPDPTPLEIVTRERKTFIYEENGQASIVVPIRFQEEILGAISLKTSGRTWTNNEIALIETVINQTALSLENARLITETKNRAEQEKLLSEVSSRMRETLDLETILQTTARELQKELGLAEVEVRILPDPSETHDTSEIYPLSSGT